MPISHSKEFEFNLANAYLLEGNYPDAKKRYWSCLDSEPNPKLKSWATNNLAIACWWHKNPMFGTRNLKDYKDSDNKSIDS